MGPPDPSTSSRLIALLLVMTAMNDESGEVNVAFDYAPGSGQALNGSIPETAKKLKARGQPWALVVDENYGNSKRKRK